ncbi:MAG: ABC transporter ATP-binding protein [Chloroflexota bacterium]|nr:ABC transporter ATP-binding protein [Chloroflexota bacterium]
MSDLAIRVTDLGKQYRIGAAPQRYRTLRESLKNALTAPIQRIRRGLAPTGETRPDTIWALRDVSFDVEQGQVLGVIGRNGAGKSTLLKILSRVTEPTEGEVEIHGRVGSLLEVGTGFHPELTGRENIYLNGAILGMKRTEIERKFDEIVDFSGVEKFIDTPVKRYSSGMYLRLAFAVAAHLEPQILVVDEVLAVGDAEFQRKCLGKMNAVAQEGRTVLFVSHNMSAILSLTEEAIVLDKGQIVHRAPSAEAVDHYLASGFSESGKRIWSEDEIPPSASPFRPVSISVMSGDGKDVDVFRSTEEIILEVKYKLAEPVQGLRVGLYLMSMRGEYVFTSFDTDEPERYNKFSVRPAGGYISRCTIPKDFFNDGRYAVGINASSYRVKRYFQDERVLNFTVDGIGAPGKQWSERRMGLVRPRLVWQIESIG